MNKDWISVEDDLPRVGETVMFCTQLGTWCGWRKGWEDDENVSWYSCDEEEFIEDVTHWMHLPEAYIEE